ncbi:exocyst complex component exo70 [Malassezia psittaci]|uniref:Exocyst complex component exo70 n=1 Tax=Malassezia psittaci TaxID=1821823 RepID=A0AAF0JM38_9BASI|nr:exocyst complex component exo70 [Malassezia psittaci]
MNGQPSSSMEHNMGLAEMELLEQNQKRLANLTSRMTTILNGFDRRLVKLESSILPIHKSTQQLSQISSNVEATKQELTRSLQHYGVVVDEEPLLLRGPNPGNPWPYLEAVQRVAQGIQRNNAGDVRNPEQVLSKMYSLVELGARHIADLVRDYTAAESSAIDLRSHLEQRTGLHSLSNECLMSIKALLQFLYTLQMPSSGASPFHTALTSYASVRSKFCEMSLEPLTTQMMQVANRMQDPSIHAPREALVHYQRHSAGIHPWLQGTIDLFQNEYSLTLSLFDGMAWQSQAMQTYQKILQPIMQSIDLTLPKLLPRLEHGLHAHRMLMLDFLGASQLVLGQEAERWAEVTRSNQPSASKMLMAFKQTRQEAMQFFSEFLRDVRVIPVQREHDVLHVDVSDISKVGIELFGNVAEYRDVMMSLLRYLGKPNWLDHNTYAQRPAATSVDALYEEYMNDLFTEIVNSLERSVVAVSQPTTAALFLLINLTYLQEQVQRVQSNLPSSVISRINKMLFQSHRAARTSYLESWNNVLSALTEAPTNPSRMAAMGKFSALSNSHDRSSDQLARFFDGVAEKEKIHQAQPLLQQNPALSTMLQEDVVRLVCPIYNVYISKQKIDPKADRRPTERDLERILTQMFRTK